MGGFYITGFSNSSVIFADGQTGHANWQIIQPVFVGLKLIHLFVGFLADKRVAVGTARKNLRVLNFHLKPMSV
jgi:hypothetical protein